MLGRPIFHSLATVSAMRRVSDFCPVFRVDRGFTLVEMIVAIVITGILVGMVGIFGRQQIDAYFDISNRAELSDAADTALRRVARDLQSALPNSVRVDATNRFLEYVPIVDAGRYRADVGDNSGGNDGGSVTGVLDFGVADSNFQVLGPPIDLSDAARLVVFNLGIPDSDIYEGSSSTAVSSYDAGTQILSFTSKTFRYPSPQNRFQVVGTPVTYECAPPNVLRHRNYGFSSTQLTSFAAPAQSDILVSNVDTCAFSYTPAVLQRNGLVVLRLKLTINGESVALMHQVDVLNTP